LKCQLVNFFSKVKKKKKKAFFYNISF